MPAKLKDLTLNVTFIKEDEMFVAYSPALDLSSCGESFEKAKKNFEEAVDIFIVECTKDGTLHEVLESLGWKLEVKNKPPSSRWLPPPVVGHVDIPISVPT